MKMHMVTLTLSLLLGPPLATVVAAQGSPATVTEQEAQAIATDAYVYFYPLVTMDVTRKQLTNVRARQGLRRPDEYVCQRAGISAGRHEGRSSDRISIRCTPAAGSI